jgi:hypothetical protein
MGNTCGCGSLKPQTCKPAAKPAKEKKVPAKKK